ncbi:hypothetical protein D5S18_23120 [Nocardia panacis]|uniref:Uncharacterized protein n=1 Tax=Nocardia panacis TaxID=2340916 RepID=A0A3A4JY38_9NOCA|nr:hypothetical protein [Nocardia panacis]RJO72073.1 hypothetical protein D5S18_23120 [Nocardia panacis]
MGQAEFGGVLGDSGRGPAAEDADGDAGDGDGRGLDEGGGGWEEPGGGDLTCQQCQRSDDENLGVFDFGAGGIGGLRDLAEDFGQAGDGVFVPVVGELIERRDHRGPTRTRRIGGRSILPDPVQVG